MHQCMYVWADCVCVCIYFLGFVFVCKCVTKYELSTMKVCGAFCTAAHILALKIMNILSSNRLCKI